MRIVAVLLCLALGWLTLAGGSRLPQLPLVMQRIARNQEAPPSKFAMPAFQYGQSTVKGVNLGGWLVLEPYMTPSLFRVSGAKGAHDEYTLSRNLGRRKATKLLQRHWSTFITEEDFRLIASYGLNHVRIPIGYWAWDISKDEPYTQGQLPYLQQAVMWAAKYGLRVMIDLHGAPGSQNGFDNSGNSGEFNWHKDPENIQRTADVLRQLVLEFAQPKYSGAVTLIEPLNEPAAFRDRSVVAPYQSFLKKAYNIIRFPLDPKISTQFVVSFHDAFLGPTQWTKFWPKIMYPNTLLDIHPYTVFSEQMVDWNITQRITYICRQRNKYAASKNFYTTIAGEWSPAVTDCAGDLNGMGAGSRYEGTFPGSTYVGTCADKTGDASKFTESYISELRQYWEAQVRVYGGYGDGWMMWNWKTESGHAEDWSYSKGVQYGWIPDDATTMQYLDPCGRTK